MKLNILFILLALSSLLDNAPVLAAPATKTKTSKTDQSDDKVDLDALGKAYGVEGSTQANVVQNRQFRKSLKLNIQAYAGTMAHDPFLNGYFAGAALGFNLSEAFGLNLLYWRAFESDSAATKALLSAELTSGASPFKPNINPVTSLLGAEANWYILYGKMSFLGLTILHLDFYLTGGAGMLGTANGNQFGPMLGIGQQIYLTQFMALRFDYRVLYYVDSLYQNSVLISKPSVFNQNLNLGFVFYLF